jgi:hypothetical protein
MQGFTNTYFGCRGSSLPPIFPSFHILPYAVFSTSAHYAIDPLDDRFGVYIPEVDFEFSYSLEYRYKYDIFVYLGVLSGYGFELEGLVVGGQYESGGERNSSFVVYHPERNVRLWLIYYADIEYVVIWIGSFALP